MSCERCKKLLEANQNLIAACNVFEKNSEDAVRVWEALRELYFAASEGDSATLAKALDKAKLFVEGT